jgi:hypothetical protein
MRRIAVVIGMLLVVGLGSAGCGALADQAVAALGAEAQALTAVGYSPDDVVPGDAPTDKPRRALKKNTLHGEIVVQTKDGSRTVLVQRGEVTALDDNGITVKSSDGFSLVWTYGEKLRVVERRTTVEAADALQVGDQVGVAGAKTDDGGTARLIVIPLAK